MLEAKDKEFNRSYEAYKREPFHQRVELTKGTVTKDELNNESRTSRRGIANSPFSYRTW
jgi:hypothetical protein